MAIIYFRQRFSLPNAVTFLRSLVCAFTVAFAGWCEFAFARGIPCYPDFLLLSPSAGWPWLWQPFTALVTIPYAGFGLSLIFDLFLMNFFLTPIFSFVSSFLGNRWFIALLAILALAGSTVFVVLASFCNASAPCSLFGGLSLAVVLFWLLLHRKGQNTLFLAFPVSRRLAFAITAIATLYSPLAARQWAHVGAIAAMATAAYLLAIVKWQLRSHVQALKGFENWLENLFRSI